VGSILDGVILPNPVDVGVLEPPSGNQFSFEANEDRPGAFRLCGRVGSLDMDLDAILQDFSYLTSLEHKNQAPKKLSPKLYLPDPRFAFCFEPFQSAALPTHRTSFLLLVFVFSR
jgi:hypothetical protein